MNGSCSRLSFKVELLITSMLIQDKEVSVSKCCHDETLIELAQYFQFVEIFLFEHLTKLLTTDMYVEISLVLH